MTSRPQRGRGDTDLSRPNVARMYDYYLGGYHNFAADREAAERIISIFPDTPAAARTNRHFLQRAVRHLAAECGVHQFLDIGAGLPTQGNVHEVTASVAPAARVAYVDHDPVAVTQARTLLSGVDTATVAQADLRDPAELLGAPEVRRLIDFTEPVAILLVSVLHFVGDDADPAGLIAQLRDATAPGSYLVLSHLTLDGVDTSQTRQGQAVYRQTTSPLLPRSRADIERLFDGYALLPPGLVWLADWRPEADVDGQPTAGVSHGYGAVGRKG